MPRSSTPSRSSSVPMRPKYKPSSIVPYTPSVSQPTLGDTVKQGFGLGVGSGLGHALIGRMFGGIGSPTTPTVSPSQKEPCEMERKSFDNCLLNNSDVCYNHQMALTQCLKLSKKDLE